MKIRNYIALSVLAAATLSGCTNDENNSFGIDNKTFTVEAVGGTERIRVSSNDSWVASASVPWITISPANGKGSKECRLIIDSALTNQVRSGVVRITKSDNSAEYQEVKIEQKGFDYAITLDEPEISIENYASLDERHFDVRVKTNVDFEVKIPDEVANWVKTDRFDVNLDRGLRPREVTVRFTWGINSVPMERTAEITFVPTSDSGVTSDMLAQNDNLTIRQNAAEEIKRGTREGDSVALLSIARSLAVWATNWESSGEKMDNWSGVTLWEEGMDGYVDSLKGRVKYARFFMFSTKEGLPFEVQYLTGAEELQFYSNVNTFQLNLDTGEYICKLEHLKRLTIGAYGLTSLHEDFTNLKELEYLDLGSNNFEKIPEIINPDNFPKLHVLKMANNQRRLIYDLSNDMSTNFGGFYQETAYDPNTKEFGDFPSRLLRWEPGTNKKGEAVTGLDTLILSVNYLQGEIPSFEDDSSVGYYTEADIANSADTLPRRLLTVKRVMPQLKMFALNFNRLTGKLPDWILWHPALDWWDPYTLFFSQEGKDKAGNLAGFSNVPSNMNYYYQEYTKKYLANMEDDSASSDSSDSSDSSTR